VRSDKEAGQITDAESNGKGVLLYKKGQNEMGLSLPLCLQYSTNNPSYGYDKAWTVSEQ
jgi:hypothetical protein